MFLICVSSSCFILFVSCASGTVNLLWSVHIWHECISNISKSICNHFEMHFKMLRYAEKPWQRWNTKTLVTKIFCFCFYNVFLCFRKDYQELNMAKSLVIKFKIAGNWAGFTMESRYLVWFYYYVMSCFWQNESVLDLCHESHTHIMAFCKLIEFTL